MMVKKIQILANMIRRHGEKYLKVALSKRRNQFFFSKL